MDVLRGLKFMKDNPNIQSDFKSGIIYYMFVTNALLQYFRLSLYCTDTSRSRTQSPINNTLVCINPDTTLYVFFNVYLKDTTRFQTPLK